MQPVELVPTVPTSCTAPETPRATKLLNREDVGREIKLHAVSVTLSELLDDEVITPAYVGASSINEVISESRRGADWPRRVLSGCEEPF